MITHDELVQRAARWLAGTRRCAPVLTEHSCWATPEQPDAFGINSGGTILVECKASVSDFYADLSKLFRRHPVLGMGRQRYYMTPPGLLSEKLLDKCLGWGLLEVHPQTVRVIRESGLFYACSNAECLLFRSAWAMGKLGENKEPESKEPTP